MPGEAYRDPLTTAKARVAQLETQARERGLPLVLDRSWTFSWATLGLLTATLGILFGILEVRLPQPGTGIDGRPLPDSRVLPKTLAWFEPATRSGPIAAATRSERLLVGLLWRRGQPTNGLRVAAFDRASLAVQWVSDPIPVSWVSADSDTRFSLSVEGQTLVRLEDNTGFRYTFHLDNGAMIVRESFSSTPRALEQVPVQDFAYAPLKDRTIGAQRGDHGFDLHIDDLVVPVPDTSTASRLQAVWQLDELVFVLVDDTLHVFDSSNGFHRGILEAP